MVKLPPVDRACLKPFMALMGIYLGASAAIGLGLLGVLHPLRWGGSIALCFGIFGLLLPSLSRFLYRAWNRIAIEFARIASTIVMGVYFYIIFVAVGRTGSGLCLEINQADDSMWLPRISSHLCSEQNTKPTRNSENESWIVSFISLAAATGQYWRYCLVPFLILLRTLDCVREETVPTDIYTLY
jgi:hypothetical protein